MLRRSFRVSNLRDALPHLAGCAAQGLLPVAPSLEHGRWFTKDGSGQAEVKRRPEGVAGKDAQVLYKGRWMLPFRVLVRLKIFQLGGVAACAMPLGTFLTEGGPTMASLGLAGALLLGCGVSASTLQYYSRRYVGELALLTHPTSQSAARLRISVLDFWGNREDNLVPLHEVVPPLKGLAADGLRQMARQPLIPLQVDGDRQYYVSLRHGLLLQRDTLMSILAGEHSSQLN